MLWRLRRTESRTRRPDPVMSEAVRTEDQIKDEAIEWVLRFNFDASGERADPSLQSWLAADPRHARAYEAAKATWADSSAVKAIDPDGARQARLLAARMTAPSVMEQLVAGWRRLIARPLLPAGAVAGLAAIMLAVFVMDPPLPGEQDPNLIATEIAEIRDVKLADGSVVTIGAKTSISVQYTETKRKILMSGGEAFFDVAHDARRPFVVAVGDSEVRVLGTKFDVRERAGQVVVAVAEGRVEVAPARSEESMAAPERREAVVLTRGQSATHAKGEAEADVRVARINPDRAGAWRTGRFSYRDAMLLEVVSDANRYFDGEIRFESDALKELRITTGFKVEQIDSMLAGLPDALPVAIEKRGRIVTIVSRLPGEQG